MRKYPLVLLLGLFIGHLQGQSRWEAGSWFGGTGYLGDLNPWGVPVLQETQPALGGMLRYRASSGLAYRFQVLAGSLRGDDQNASGNNSRWRRDFAFSSRFAEFSTSLEWDPWGSEKRKMDFTRRRSLIIPVFKLGFGALYLDSETNFSVDEGTSVPVLIKRDQEQDLSILPGLILGTFWKTRLGRTSELSLEWNAHYQRSDYLDGISYAGNPGAKDWMMTLGTGLTFRFQPKDSDGDGVEDKEDACPRLAGSPGARGCPDRDGDGVEDAEDACPDQPGLMEFSGCADSDGDGIMDKADQCPVDFGYEDTGGCPDRDNDCVIDSLDACPDLEGLSLFDGCPDTDADSIPDPEDDCPLEAGLPEHGGCPLADQDCDGIVDIRDLCPHTPDTLGFSGCPDTDGDGWIDPEDCCPNEPGIDSLQGCPELKVEEKKLLEKARKEVRFKTGSADLLPASRKILDQIVDLVAKYPAFSLDIHGHTDSQGKAELNLVLSRKRARACFDYLVSRSVPKERIKWAGFGEEKPIRENSTPQGRAVNRRVEFELILRSDAGQ